LLRRQEAGGRRQKAGGRRQKAEGRRQEAGGRRQEVLRETNLFFIFFFDVEFYPIPNSQFPIPNSQFPIPNSPLHQTLVTSPFFPYFS
ncbi:MAG: hypothetical protein F6K41_11120, partial [Symploca sp. SIO3E6]|nr:hypothetical protein [Caldora sp. SIO3E6]